MKCQKEFNIDQSYMSSPGYWPTPRKITKICNIQQKKTIASFRRKHRIQLNVTNILIGYLPIHKYLSLQMFG